MSLQEIKSRIHQLVDAVDDETLLEEVNRVLSGETETDSLDDLTDEQLIKIEEAREAVRQGNYVPHEVIREKHRKRFPTANI